jgi:phage tail P2-like protein
MSNSLIEQVQVDLLQLLPDSLKVDPNVVYLAQAISESMQDLSSQVLMLDPDKKFGEPILQLIAWQEHVDFYDPLLPIEKKQELVDKSSSFHEKKGTPAAVEDLISTVFEDGKVVEWFEYDGAPYTFKVVTSNPAVTQEKAADFIRALNSVKNIRSRLEKVEITQSDDMNVYFGGFVHIGDKMEIKQVV